jgi:hypothetical protein
LKFKALVLKNSSWSLMAAVDAGTLSEADVAKKKFSFQSGRVRESDFHFDKTSGSSTEPPSEGRINAVDRPFAT